MKNIHAHVGSLTVICGPMFSGKTEELIRRVRRAKCANKEILVFKHSFDDRYNKKCIVSHTGDKIESINAKNSAEIMNDIIGKINHIFIDEIQFFSSDVILTIMELRKKGIDITVAGLDLDFRGIPFGAMPDLLALADEIIKLKAVCFKTGNDAQYSQRIINGCPAKYTDPIVLIAATDYYEARSKDAFEIDYVPLKEYLDARNSIQ